MTSNPAYLLEEPESINNLSDLSNGQKELPPTPVLLNGSLDNNSSSVNLTSAAEGLPNDGSGAPHHHHHHKKELWHHVLAEIVIPFFIAGFGMVAAGVLLDHVQSWELYINVREVIVLVPALLGLKGNLEMTLASRLSTQVNLGHIHDSRTIKKAVLGNFAITQLQSIIVGFLASFVACVTEFILEQKFKATNLLTLIGSSVTTASVASLILGGIIMFIIIISRNCRINPDNIATPIASSLGDLVTLAILSGIGTFLYIYRDLIYIHIVLIILFLLLIPLQAYYCYTNEFVKETLYHGWIPIIIAMFISSAAGIILDFAIKIFDSIAIYQPVVNGVGGNLVAIFASRLSTALHKTDIAGQWATWAPAKCVSFPYESFFSTRNPEHKTAIILFLLALPGHTIFFFTIYYIKPVDERPELTAWLFIFYMIISLVQVLFLLILCYWLVHFVWKMNKNPDITCIPLLTATGDFLGVSLLFLAFYLVYLTGNTSVKTRETTLFFNSTMPPMLNGTNLTRASFFRF